MGGKEQRHANCAGCLAGPLGNTRPSDCIFVRTVASPVLCLGKWVLAKAQCETWNTVSRFYHVWKTLFKMGRSVCPGLIDGGLNITDTLETTRIWPVKPLIFQFICGEYRWMQPTDSCSTVLMRWRSGRWVAIATQPRDARGLNRLPCFDHSAN